MRKAYELYQDSPRFVRNAARSRRFAPHHRAGWPLLERTYL
ncbi:hypothetical protein [Oscillatoria acuminata]|nr:hypothetical protein [Oscillatoria acuminata]